MEMKPGEEWGYLKHIPVFAHLPEEQLKEIHHYTKVRQVAKGSTIFWEGEPGEGFHYVKSGKVKIVKMSDDGREHIIKILNAGELFAEVLLFTTVPYSAIVVAVENSQIGVIPNSDLEKLVLNNNSLALELIKALSEKLVYAQQKIKNLALHDVTARTAEVLLTLGREQGQQKADGSIEIELDMSRQELANLVGTTRETVTRTLTALKKEQIIDYDGGRIQIMDAECLKRMLM